VLENLGADFLATGIGVNVQRRIGIAGALDGGVLADTAPPTQPNATRKKPRASNYDATPFRRPANERDPIAFCNASSICEVR
jgi:hypothetical protein